MFLNRRVETATRPGNIRIRTNRVPKQLFQGELALVTGAGRGIGAALVSELAARGARVAVTDLELADAERVAVGLDGDGHSSWTLDVTDRGQIEDVRDELHARGDRVQILVNNAGVVFGGPFAEVPFEKHQLTLRVNTEAALAVTHAFLGDLIAAERAHILQVASASGFLGLPFGASYAASKWAVLGFSESLRLELGQLGHRHVSVTSLCPSYISTGLFEGVEPPRLTRLLTPETVAVRAIRATARGKRRVLTPWLVKIAPILVGAPASVSDAVNAGLGVSRSMRTWRGRGEGR